MWLQPKLLGRRCRGEMKNKRNNYHFPHWPQRRLGKYRPVQALSKKKNPKNQKNREVSPPETLLPSGELLVELGFMIDAALLIHSYLHGSISCVS